MIQEQDEGEEGEEEEDSWGSWILLAWTVKTGHRPRHGWIGIGLDQNGISSDFGRSISVCDTPPHGSGLRSGSPPCGFFILFFGATRPCPDRGWKGIKETFGWVLVADVFIIIGRPGP